MMIVLAAWGLGCGPSSPQTAQDECAFGAADEAAVRALEEAYRTSWLANDSVGVMATLHPDAVIMPGGLEPIRGSAAIRAFWWPDDGSSTRIDAYEIEVEEVEGCRDLAYLRGRGTLAFTYQAPDGQETSLTSETNHLSLARRDASGTWRIIRRAWSAVQ